jgi:hypothetical protein
MQERSLPARPTRRMLLPRAAAYAPLRSRATFAGPAPPGLAHACACKACSLGRNLSKGRSWLAQRLGCLLGIFFFSRKTTVTKIVLEYAAFQELVKH